MKQYEDNPEKLKKFIKEKFRTLSRFAEVSGLDRYEIQKAFTPFYFQNPKYVRFRKEIYEKASKTGLTVKQTELSAEQLKALRKAIDDKGGCYKFSQEVGFRVYDIYNGTRVRISGQVEQLINYFGL